MGIVVFIVWLILSLVVGAVAQSIYNYFKYLLLKIIINVYSTMSIISDIIKMSFYIQP